MAISTKTAADDALYTGLKTPSEFGSKPLPDHVELQREEIVEPPTNEFRAENERDKLPRVHGWNILIVPYTQPRKTRGGIYVPDKTLETEQLATIIGYVVEVGPLAYQDKSKFGEDQEPWCKPGDYVIFGRYAGAKITMHGERDDEKLACRILSDDEILATVANPADYIGVS
jgi:co-chaperonin GroES (HSP10)